MKSSMKNKPDVSHGQYRIIYLTLLVLLTMTGVANAQSDFTGTWKYNESKSEFSNSNGPRFGGGDIVAKQSADLLTVDRSMKNRDGETMHIQSKFTLDGKECTNEFRGRERKSIATWSADEKSLTIVTTFSFNGNEMQSTQVWKLRDKNTLAVTSTRQGRDCGEFKTTFVYDKE